MKRTVLGLLAAALLCLCAPACAQVQWHGPGVVVLAHSLQEESWLFLPAGADLHALVLSDGGEPAVVDWAAQSQESPDLPGVHKGEWMGEPLNVMVSTLRSVHLFSADPENEGRVWLEDCDLHQKETTGQVVMLNRDGSVFLNEALSSLRGRGNSTWQKAEHKKPFQFKLTYAADVLNTGLPHERSRTWTLLSNEQDPAMLRNQVALDLAKELGLESSSRCEAVDLYYDGDYRGAYLLAEKIEVGPSGVDMMDFDKLLKPINREYGAPDPDDLPSPTQDGNVPPTPDGENAYGLAYGYADGAYDNTMVDAGGYLLELESFGTLGDQGWFLLPNGRYISIKNPEYAGETMVRHVSELFLAAYETMMNYGFHPETGAPLERFVDVDSFTRSHLVQELMLSMDGYMWSSTFFVLPEGQSKFYAGPVWDFDRVIEANWPGLKDNNVFSQAFYRTTVFQEAAQQICEAEVAPLLENILLGTQQGQYLRPLAEYQRDLRMSWLMNFCRHHAQTQGLLGVERQYQDTMNQFADFVEQQFRFVLGEVAAWGGDETTHEVDMDFLLPYGDVHDLALTRIINEPHGSIYLEDVQITCVEEATEDDFAIYQADFTFQAKPGCEMLEDFTAVINGDAYTGETDGRSMTLSFTFEDPSYRPAVLDGVDYGMVFNYEYYMDNYPELWDWYGDDREAVLAYFRDEGMALGDVATEFFDPLMIMDTCSTSEKYGTDWPLYYQTFMDSPGTWMKETDNTYMPELEQLP